jgi:hypothetical protein
LKFPTQTWEEFKSKVQKKSSVVLQNTVYPICYKK